MPEFDWDDGNLEKCCKHGLTLAEVEYALTHGAHFAPDVKHSVAEQRFIAIGRTGNDRPVFVAFCWRGDRLRPISARYMHAREAARYEQTFGSAAQGPDDDDR